VKIVGTVESVWRYPVKSMRGEELPEAFVGFGGVYGDRVFAFRSSAAPKAFPYLTGREQQDMLRCQPMFRHPDQMAKPPNLAEAEALGPGVTPVHPDADGLMVDVRMPGGETLAIDDPRLPAALREGMREELALTLLRSNLAMTDCRPISLFSMQTVGQLSREVGADLDKRRFRANVYMNLGSGRPFEEDEFVGRTLRVGKKAVIAVLDRDPRCKMITLDPETGEANPEVIRQLAHNHETKAGVYAAVLVEGTITAGDEIVLV
jgi:uncharacterized protein YcbX